MNGPINEGVSSALARVFSRRSAILKIVEEKALGTRLYVKQWPEVDDGKLFSHILRTKAVDVEYIGKYNDQKAYLYWMSGFVDTVLFTKCPVDSKHANNNRT